METRCWLLVTCCAVVLVVSLVSSVQGEDEVPYTQRPEVVAYEKALMEQLEKLRGMGKDGQNQDSMKAAMDSVEHLKPANMPIQEMIGLMGRVFQKQMGMNIAVKTPEEMEKEEAEKKAKKEEEKEKKKKAKKEKKEKKKEKRGPSISKTEL